MDYLQFRRLMYFSTACTLLVLLFGCSKPEPIFDLRASGEQAKFAQRDQMECEWLLERHDLGDEVISKCLENRGHSILGVK